MSVHFSKASDEWATPRALFDELDQEFNFDWDAAASDTNSLVGFGRYFGPDHPNSTQVDALTTEWGPNFAPSGPQAFIHASVFCNPPYSQLRAFVAKAHEEARLGHATTVMLIPARTDTRAFHDHIWDRDNHRPRPGVEVRFLKGRLKFGGSANAAPFPSMIVVFKAGAVT